MGVASVLQLFDQLYKDLTVLEWSCVWWKWGVGLGWGSGGGGGGGRSEDELQAVTIGYHSLGIFSVEPIQTVDILDMPESKDRT